MAQPQTQELKQIIGETVLALAEACIRCARHSLRLLTESWIDGSFAIFDYTYTQYLFSSATVLAVSSFSIGRNDENDQDSFETAKQFLEQLRRNGNFAAREYCQHIEAIIFAMATFRSKYDPGGASRAGLPNLFLGNSMPLQAIGAESSTPSNGFQPTMTAEMALAEPSLQDFLSQGDLDLSFLDTHMQDSRFQSLYIAPQDQDWIAR